MSKRETYHVANAGVDAHGRPVAMLVALWTRWLGTDGAPNAYEVCALDGTPLPSGRRVHLDAESTSA